MQRTDAGWIVLDRDAAVLTNAYIFDGKSADANTFIARMSPGKLMVFSPPVGATEAMHAQLAEFGEVAAVVANNGFHHLGQPQWRARYPDARFFAPKDAMARIAKKNPDAPTFEPLSELKALLGPDVGVGEATSTKCGESWAWAKIEGGYAWFCSDLLANMPKLPPKFPIRQMFKWSGSAPGYRPFNLAMKFTLKDKSAVLRKFSEDLKAHPPTLVVPGHGGVLRQENLAAETQQVLATAIK